MLKIAPLFSALLVCATAASAQSIKPGLWEMQHKMGGNPQIDQAMAQMQKQMAAMSPAQRKQMEAMMGQQGMTMPTPGAGGGMAMKVMEERSFADYRTDVTLDVRNVKLALRRLRQLTRSDLKRALLFRT